jgi:hypothetical protein
MLQNIEPIKTYKFHLKHCFMKYYNNNLCFNTI